MIVRFGSFFPFPILILAPATLIVQWQVEILDQLGIPSAIWSSQKKCWLGVEGQELSPRCDMASIKKCPYQIAIVSTGLITHQWEGEDFTKESGFLLKKRFGTVILDEAHKARFHRVSGNQELKPNRLMRFMQKIAARTCHMILGTATPIQTDVRELWDLLEILNKNAMFVLGDQDSLWHQHEKAIQIITGKTQLTSDEVLDWLKIRSLPGKHIL
ncbi:SNF2-related protein [Bartonella sp. B35(2025)]